MADVTTPASGEQIEDKLYTIEEFEEFLETVEDARHYQLLEGEIIYVPPPELKHSVAASLIVYYLWDVILTQNSGQAGVEVGYRPDKDKKNWLEMDAAYLSFARFPFETTNTKSVLIAPDICIEVVSPGNTWQEINTKVKLYLAGGASLVWVIDLKRREITIYRADGTFETLESNGVLTAGGIAPDFSLKLPDFWARIAK